MFPHLLFFPLGSTSSASLDVHSEPRPYYCTKECRRYSTATNMMLPSVARQPQVVHLQVALMVESPESGILPRFSSLLYMPCYNHNPSKTCRLSMAVCTTAHLASVSHAGASLLRLTYFTIVTNTSLKVPTTQPHIIPGAGPLYSVRLLMRRCTGAGAVQALPTALRRPRARITTLNWGMP